MRNILEKICVENRNTHDVFNTFHENCVIYEIMWKNYGIAGQATDDNSIRRWINKVADKTQNIYYLLLFTATVITRTRLNVMYICLFCSQCTYFYRPSRL